MADNVFEGMPRLPVDTEGAAAFAPTPAYQSYLDSRVLPDTDLAASRGVENDPNYLAPMPEWMKAATQGGLRFASNVPVLAGAAANLGLPGLGDPSIRAGLGMQRRAEDYTPAIDAASDVHGVSDALAYARNKLLESAPDLALMAVGGGVGSRVAGSVAKGAAKKAIGEYVDAAAIREGLDSATPEVQAVADRMKDTAAQKVTDAIGAHTAEESLAPQIAKARTAGVVAGMYPSTVGSDAEQLEGADRTDTAKFLSGDVGVAALGALPEVRLFGRIFGDDAAKAVAENTQKFLPRVVKEVAIQGGLGATAGVAQTAAALGVHKWVNDNVDLMSPRSMAAYMESGIAGGTLGAVMGGAVEGVHAAPFKGIGGKIVDAIGTAAQKSRETFDTAKSSFDTNLAALKASMGDPTLKSESLLAYPPERENNPYTLGSKVQDMVGRFISPESDLWKPDNVSQLDQLTKSAAKALENQNLTTQDNVNLTELANHVDGGLDTINLWKKAGETHFAEKQNAIDEEPVGEGDAEPPKNTGGMDALDTLIATPENAAEHPDALTAAKRQLKVDLWDGKQGSQSGQSNVITENTSTEKARNTFAAKAASPETVELAGGFKYGNKQMPRRALFEMGNLVSNELQRTPGLSLRGAYDSALSNLRLLGYEVDPDSIKAGTIWKDKNNAENKLELSDSDAKAIRDGYKTPEPGSVKANALEKARAANQERGSRIEALGNAFTAAHAAEAGANAHGASVLSADDKLTTLLKANDKVKARTGQPSPKLDAKITARAHELLSNDATMQQHGQTLSDARAKVKELAPHLYEQQGASEPTGFDLNHAEEHQEVADTRHDSPELREREPPPTNRASSNDPYRGYFAAKEGEGPTKAGAAIAKVRALRDELIHETLGSNDPAVKALLKRIDNVLPKQSAAPTEGEVPAAKRSRMEILNDLAPALKNLRDIADKVGGKIGKAELEAQIRAHPDAPQDFQKQLDDLPNKTHEWFKRAAAGEFARAQVSEMPPDFNKLVPLNKAVNDAQTRFEKAEATYQKHPTNDYARAEYKAAQRDLEDAKAARDDASGEHPPAMKEQATFPEAGTEGSSGGFSKTDFEAGREGEGATTAKTKPSGLVDLKAAAEARKAPSVERTPTKPDAVPETKVEGKPVKGMEGKLERGTLKSESLTPVETIAKSGKNDHAKLEKIANDLLARLGIKDKVTVGRYTETGRGDYNPNSSHIRINDSVTGARRVEVLAHELGHHIKRVALAKASPEVRAAISKDYENWVNSSGALDSGSSVRDVQRSRNPFNIGNEGGGDRSVGSLTPEESKYLTSFDEYIADHISRALTHSDKSPVGKFFSGLVDTLKKAYKLLFGEHGGKDYAPAPSVEKWINGLFDKQTRDASDVLGHTVPKDVAETMTEAAAASEHTGSNEAAPPPPDEASSPSASGGGAASPPPGVGGRLPPSRDNIKNLFNLIRYNMGDKNREILARKTDNPSVLKRLGELFPQYRKDLLSAAHGEETRIALAYLAHKDGQLNFGKTARSLLTNTRDDLHAFFHIAKDSDYALRAFNDMAEQRVENLRKSQQSPLRDAKAFEDRRRGDQQKLYNGVLDTANKITAPFRGLFESSVGRMQATQNPAIRKIAALLHLHTGEGGKDRGYLSAVAHTQDMKSRQWSDIVNSASPVDIQHAIAHMQRQTPDDQVISPQVQDIVNKMRGFFSGSAGYIKEVKPGFNEKPGFYPVLSDLKNAADEEKLRTLLSQPKYAADVAKASKLGPSHPDGTPTTPDEHVNYLVNRAKSASPSSHGVDDQDTMTKGVFRSEFKRSLDFIYTHPESTQADKDTFASIQSKDPTQVTSRYILPMVKRVESVRRFGDKDERLEAMIADAKKQGASDEQIKQVRNAVAGARGEVGLDGSPVLKKFLGDSIASRLANPQSKKGMQALAAYQNVRVLPLVTLSSLVDPLNIAVRTGSFKHTWDGFKLGIKSLYDKSTREEMLAHLRTLGSADDFYTNGILGERYGGSGDSKIRKANEMIFKAYGLDRWTRATRYMALQAAHGFLGEHAAMDNPKSERYLGHELNLKPGDVRPSGKNDNRVKVLSDEERASASKDELARDDRVRKALLRVVDESILRPNAQMTPNWHADPYMGLVTQYKAFAYAMHDQIGKRIWHELQHGNLGVLGPALSYVPSIIAVEMLRGFLQYGPGGNPQRDKWGPGDWVNYALMRAGYAKPSTTFGVEAAGDRSRGQLAGTSLLGPTFQQGRELASAASGGEPLGTAALHAAPGEALYQHWGGSGRPSGGVPRRGLSYGSP